MLSCKATWIQLRQVWSLYNRAWKGAPKLYGRRGPIPLFIPPQNEAQ